MKGITRNQMVHFSCCSPLKSFEFVLTFPYSQRVGSLFFVLAKGANVYSLGAQALIGHSNDNVRYQGRLNDMCLSVGKEPCLTSEVGIHTYVQVL